MELFHFSSLISLLTLATVMGAWWVAAVKKPGIGIFFWLASLHTVSFGLNLFLVCASSAATSWPGFFPLISAISIAHAVLYVQLVRWLLARS